MNNFFIKTLKYSDNFLKKVKVNNKTKKIKKKKESGLLGVGKHGKAYNLGKNQFQLLDEEKIINISLYGLNENIKITKEEDIKNFLIFLKSMKNKFVKLIITDKVINKEEQIKKNFFEEIKSNQQVLKIYGNKSSKFLTVQPIGIFKKCKIMGCIVTNKNNEKYHLIFGNKCDNNFILNEGSLKKYILEILQSIEILQKNGFQHDDIKLDNSVKCNGMYKLIDWGKLRSINRVSIRTIFGLNHSPILLYIYQTHGLLSKFVSGLPVMETFDLESFLIKNFNKNLTWMRNLLKYPLFKKTIERVKIELKQIICMNIPRNKLLEKYKYTSDIYMFGIEIIYILYKFKINPDKFEVVIEKFTSLLHPVKNASDAINFVKKNI
jgi:serine/threonine protein kinase